MKTGSGWLGSNGEGRAMSPQDFTIWGLATRSSWLDTSHPSTN